MPEDFYLPLRKRGIKGDLKRSGFLAYKKSKKIKSPLTPLLLRGGQVT